MLAYLSILSAIIAGMAGAPIVSILICAAGLGFTALRQHKRVGAFKLKVIHAAASLALAGLISVGAFWWGTAMAGWLQI